MMNTKEFKKAVFDLFHRYLTSKGMEEKKSGIYIGTISEDTLSWLGLNEAIKDGGEYIKVNPLLGIRHQGIARLVADLTGEKMDPFSPPTVSMPLGYLTPKRSFTTVDFFLPWDIGPPFERFTQDFEEYGSRFYEAGASLAGLLGYLEDRMFRRPNQTDYYLPACYYLLGEYSKAEGYVENRLENRTKGSHLTSDYENYAIKIRDLVRRATAG
jgi:hypothetical protein